MLRLREVAERLGCSISNVYALKDAGLLAVIRTGAGGKGFVVEEAELERFIRERREHPGKSAPPASKTSNPRLFKHLDGDRLLAAWRRRENPAARPDASNAPSS